MAAAQYLGNRSTIIGKSANNLASQTGTNNTVIGFNAQQSSTTVDNEITIGNTAANSLRLPGLQASASDGDVLTYSSSSGDITLQPSSGGGITGSTTGTGGLQAITDIRTLTSAEHASITPAADVLYIIV